MICRFVKALSGRPSFAALVLGMVFGAMSMQAWCQAPGYPQAQPAPAYPQPQPAQPMQPPAPGPPAQQQQMPGEYAFRGDLTNPQYGECLALERTWQANWYRYAAEYQRAIMMNPKDPNLPADDSVHSGPQTTIGSVMEYLQQQMHLLPEPRIVCRRHFPLS